VGAWPIFDISIDTKARTSAAHLTANTTIRGTQDAWTADFAAPELISSRHATRHCDIFAYGKTVHAVKSHCEPEERADTHGNMGRGQTAQFISALTSCDPELRPPAKKAMQDPFFTVLKDVSRKVTQTCALCEMSGNDAVYGADEGIQCSEGHFHCGSCLTDLTQNLLKVENQTQLAQREAQVMCFKFPLECRAPGFHAGDLARHLPVEDLQALLKARIDVMNQQKASELEDQRKFCCHGALAPTVGRLSTTLMAALPSHADRVHASFVGGVFLIAAMTTHIHTLQAAQRSHQMPTSSSAHGRTSRILTTGGASAK
jgi:hypothetical protein